MQANSDTGDSVAAVAVERTNESVIREGIGMAQRVDGMWADMAAHGLHVGRRVRTEVLCCTCNVTWPCPEANKENDVESQ